MDAIHNLTSFIIAGILLNLTPGQDTLYILGRSIAQGRKAGIISVFGISSGALIHIFASAFGLSAILMTSAVTFSIIKYIGAGYLVYLGIKMLRNKKSDADFERNIKTPESDSLTIYKQGILTNVLNPKVALFFMAFLPQFIDTSKASSPVPFLILGGIFLTTGTIWCLVVAVFSAYASRIIIKRFNFRRTLEKISGGLFILLGLKLALEKN